MSRLTLSQAKKRAKWPLAIHEAGHAVVARRLGVQVHEASIEPEKNTVGHVNHGETTHYQDILVTLAGPLATRMLDHAGAEYDPSLSSEESEAWDQLLDYAESEGIELGEDDAERRLQLHELYAELSREVTTMLTAHWSVIESVALGLMNHKTLSGRTVAL